MLAALSVRLGSPAASEAPGVLAPPGGGGEGGGRDGGGWIHIPIKAMYIGLIGNMGKKGETKKKTNHINTYLIRDEKKTCKHKVKA